MKDRTLSPSEVCRIFGISKSTLFRWERDGKIPPVPRVRAGLMSGRAYGAEHLEALSQLLEADVPKNPVVVTVTILIDAAKISKIPAVLERLGARVLMD